MLFEKRIGEKNSKQKGNNAISRQAAISKKNIAVSVNKNCLQKNFKNAEKKNVKEIQTNEKYSEYKKIKNISKKLLKHNKSEFSKSQVALKPEKINSSFDNENYLKNIPNFDHIPSDSEEESDETKTKDINLNKSNDNSGKKFYTSFTENTIFVGNIPLTYDKKKIIKIFSRFGKVICARIRCVPIPNINVKKKVAAIKKEYNSHRNSMVAYVKFKSDDSVKAAIEANGMILDGHHLRIDSAKSSGDKDFNKAVFVGGLPFGNKLSDIEDDELWEFFENCGKINSVRVIRDSHTLMGKGVGYVNFDSTTSVELALQMDGQELKKKIINVKRCLDTRKKNKVKSFGKNKTKEMVQELLSKRNQTELKIKNKKLKNKQSDNDFLGTKATIKQKKKKKPSKDALRKKQITKLLNKS